jgi:hypothetical protein
MLRAKPDPKRRIELSKKLVTQRNAARIEQLHDLLWHNRPDFRHFCRCGMVVIHDSGDWL